MVGKRLDLIRKQTGQRKIQFAESIGLSSGGYNDIISGRNKSISRPVLKALEYGYSVNPDWLLTGEGDMFLEPKGNANTGNSGGNIIQTSGSGNTYNIKYSNKYYLSDDEAELVESYREGNGKKLLKLLAKLLPAILIGFMLYYFWPPEQPAQAKEPKLEIKHKV
ncbi:MAG: helix-turn-helix transcriptional regulator [Leptospiraceae bacterium]|nr:helix-turn-helix transcriptional regulator [Leptospiraceae bacterium]MCP5502658.1 helix-turn-helix transcriptional regulator [Leptospiraceae bacterium]